MGSNAFNVDVVHEVLRNAIIFQPAPAVMQSGHEKWQHAFLSPALGHKFMMHSHIARALGPRGVLARQSMLCRLPVAVECFLQFLIYNYRCHCREGLWMICSFNDDLLEDTLAQKK